MADGRHLVAVVDDDHRVLASLTDLLESAGLDVRAFPEAAALLASDISAIDCLITDIGMPGMDGLELLRLIKQARPGIAAFVITGRDEPSDRQAAAAAKVRGFFRKPFDTQRLLAEVKQSLNDVDGG